MYYDTELGTTLYTQQNSLEIRGLDAPAGTYACLAWCGLENPGETRADSFEVPEVEIGKTTRQEIICMMKRDIYDDQTHHSSEELTDLYHGTTYVTIYDPSDEQFKGLHDYSLNLTKDTNNIRIMINQDGKMVDMDDFEVTIMDNNGTLKPDNEIDESDEQITYHPYEIGETNPAQEMRYRNLMTRASILPTASGAASLKISRLMNNHDVRLSVKSKTGNGELNVNLVENALRSKDFDLRNHNLSSAISNQQYLDFQDTYVLHFFFQSGVDLSNAVININGYTVYDQNVDMGN